MPDDIVADTFRALGIERPEAWMTLPKVAADTRSRAARLAERAARFESLYRIACDHLNALMATELLDSITMLADALDDLAARAEASVDDGDMDAEDEARAEGRAAGYRRAAASLRELVTVRGLPERGNE